MGKNYDAIVVGGGVIGSSVAYSLAKRGLKVILLEKERLASQASQAAAGMLAAQAEMTEAGSLFDLSRKSRNMFPKLAEELKELSGIDIALTNKGMFKIAVTEEQVKEYQQMISFQREAGEQVEWYTGEQLRKKERALSEVALGGLYLPNDGHVLAPELSIALAKSAAQLGATIQEYTEASSFILENGKVQGVKTDRGDLHSEHVIVTTGAWSKRLLRETGIESTDYPVKGECFSVVFEKPILESTIFSHGCYLVPKKGGRLIVGATMKENTYDRKVSVDGIASLLEKAKRLMPGIVEAEWEKTWAGIRPQTADGVPYLGEHPDWQGLFVATGHYRNGILLSPITGEIIADLVEKKPYDDVDLTPFRIQR
ncbi:glycine oxidase ThiO [Chengkuizengella axinellae]|uniref:Aerobic glycerol-3-phosphate dehydrogenase n=1 Tax=Chengkuizengella axinellae TaxID=3064388 RepID=A0ABT9J161_9BACL|nr:glycine oxidase ThiO [Chengkuizengella sp. 2205SS18-9]MDP5274755.1 glycine oxidase ThiO [Chengkuizengella sp. 2205SS18-9]